DKKRLPRELQLLAALNDDSSAVGRRHFAFIFKYEIGASRDWVAPRRGEKAVTELRWLNASQPGFSLRQFEYWSQLCLRKFFPDFARTEPSFLIRRRRNFRPPSLLCVLGQVGSGKTEATRAFVDDCDYHEINSGAALARLLGVPPVPKTPRLKFQALAQQFIQTDGAPERLARQIWDETRSSGKSRILVDGVRHQLTLEALQK